VAATLAALTGCGADREPRHPEWVLRSQVVFLSGDLQSARAPLPVTAFRLQFPYIAGDLYGAPSIGDFIHPTLGADYRFQVDLNDTHGALLASLEPTQFTLTFLRIDPPQARIARLAPQALQADGIEQVGRADWVDPSSGHRLLLVYFDRPARITGHTAAKQHSLRYEIRADAPGYVWIDRLARPDEDLYTVIPQPVHVILAVTPEANAPPTTASRADTNTPGR